MKAELVKVIVEKAGLSEKKAEVVVEIMADFLKEKLPAPLNGYVDTALSGGNLDMSALGNITSGLGGLFGKK